MENKNGLSDFENNEELTVTLTLEDDSELECAVLTIFPVEENQYIALLPISDNGEDDDDGEVYLYRFLKQEGDEMELQNIENDEEFEKVSDAFDELLAEEEFDQLFDE